VEDIVNLRDDVLCGEIDGLCPILGAALRASMGQTPTSGRDYSAMRLQWCYSIIFKARYGLNRANVVTHRNDQLMMAAGAKKASFSWFNKMGFTNAYPTANRKNKKFAIDHDAEVVALDWW